MEELSSTDHVNILLDHIKSADDQERLMAGQIFNALGRQAINDALDQLRNTVDSDIRVKLMHLITAAKSKAVPLVAARIKKDEPWYYLRNIAYLLGHMGNEDSARTLSALLNHRNIKVRHEALRSIQRIGGAQKASLLLSGLAQTDEEFKISLIEALGQAKADIAVNPLLDLLKSRPLMSSAARTTLEEKICAALGAIGSPDAIPYLSEIAESKSFLGIRSYPDKVKSAAAKALVILRRKVAESGPNNI